MAGYLGSVPVPQATQHRESFTCTAGQTTFNTAGYTPQFIDVYLNGVHLSPADVTATNGSDVVLAACLVNDIVDVISYTPFEVADQTFTGTTTMDVVAIGGATTIATDKKLIFRDSAINISSTADGDMSIAADDEIDITSTLIDINGAVDMSSTLAVAGVSTFTGDVNITKTGSGDDTTLKVASSSNSGDNDATVIVGNGGTGDSMIRFDYEGTNTDRARIGVIASDQVLRFYTGGDNERFKLTSAGAFVTGALDVSTNAVIDGNLSVGSGTPSYVLDVEGATSGDWLAHLYNSHATNGYGLKVRAGDNQDVTSFRVSNQDNSLTFLNVYGNGAVTMPAQPAFSATVNATQSNLAVDAAVRVKFAVVTFDNNSDFTVSTGDGQGGDGSNVTAVFTAPVGGKYQLNLMLRLADLDAASAYYIVSIHTSNRLYRFIYDPDFGQDAGYWASSLAVLADMDISDTAFVSVVQHSGTAQTDVDNSPEYTVFSGYLVA